MLVGNDAVCLQRKVLSHIDVGKEDFILIVGVIVCLENEVVYALVEVAVGPLI